MKQNICEMSQNKPVTLL